MFPGPPIGTVRLNNSDDDLNELGSSWEERHRRARSVRLLVMFLTMLLLMDGDPKSREIRRHDKSSKKKSIFNGDLLDPENSSLGSGVGETFVSSQWRMEQFYRIQSAIKNHPRLAQLSKMNVELLKSEQEESYGKDQDTPKSYSTSQKRHYYYPSNATGQYRGSWTRLPLSAKSKLNATYKYARTPRSTPDFQVQQALLSTNESIALILLPEVSPFTPRSWHICIISPSPYPHHFTMNLFYCFAAGRIATQPALNHRLQPTWNYED